MRNLWKTCAGGSSAIPESSTAGLVGEGPGFGQHCHPELWGGEGGGCGRVEEGCICAAIQVWALQGEVTVFSLCSLITKHA